MRRRITLLLLLVFGALCCGGQDVNPKYLTQLPGGTLLVGYPPSAVWVTTPSESLKLQPGADEIASGICAPVYPSITRDGSIVATARVKTNKPRRVAIATYSLVEKKWTEYVETEFEFSSAIAISPDGTKLAYLEEVKRVEGPHDRVHVINLKTLEHTIGPEIRWRYPAYPFHFNHDLSWSPQGNRLAYGGHPIQVWDMDHNGIWVVADGQMPAWSPDGKWIAYLESEKDERHSTVAMVHPDGTGDRILVTLPRNNAFVERPVWSPDSKMLLLNRLWNGEDAWTMEIQLLDLATLKLKTKFKDVMPVHAWAEATSP